MAGVMAMSQERKRALVRDLRDAVVQTCSAAGLLLGLLWAFNNPATPDCSMPAKDAAPGAITDCFSTALLESLMPYVAGMGVGALAGMLAGAFFARLIPLESSTRRPRSTRTVAAPAGAGRAITARYAGRCATCATPVRPGDLVRHTPGRVVCPTCAGG